LVCGALAVLLFPNTLPEEVAMAFTWPAGKRMALTLSFDDARASQVDEGTPLLDKHGVKATFYVLPSGVNKHLQRWRDTVAAGHEIGNHTASHPCSCNFAWTRHNALEDYTLAHMEMEFRGADQAIEQLLGVKTKTFAYPCGQQFVGRGKELQSYVPLVARHFLIGRGYRAETPADPGSCDLANMPASGSDGASFEELKALIAGTAAAGGWLILCAHEIGNHGPNGMTTDVLDALCRYGRDEKNGIWIDTVANIGAYLKKKRSEK
jgi:peptidoglycan-N-acetylglucosamine deacetylase